MEYRYTIFLLGFDNKITNKFVYTDYDDVQNLIGYMVDGANSLNITIAKEEVKDDE